MVSRSVGVLDIFVETIAQDLGIVSSNSEYFLFQRVKWSCKHKVQEVKYSVQSIVGVCDCESIH